jgi:hypothetical protein
MPLKVNFPLMKHTYFTRACKNKHCAKQNAVLEHSVAPKLEESLSLKKNYLNTSMKHRTMATVYLKNATVTSVR